MEGTHGELGAGLADGLGRDDADGLARVDRLADGQVDAVAPGADAALGLAGQDAADEDPVDAVGTEHLGVGGHEHVVGVEEDLAGGGVGDGHGGVAAVDADRQGLDLLALLKDGGGPDALGGAAVVLADDDILGDVDQAAGQVAGVRGTQGGIGQALAGASAGDEVLQDGQALAEVRLDGDLDGLARGVRHQAAHAGQLADLVHGASGAGVCHHVDGVVLVEAVLQRAGYVLRGLLPLVDDKAVALVVGDEAAAVLLFNVEDLLLGCLDKGLLSVGHSHVRDGDGQRADSGVLEAERLDIVEHLGGNREPVLLYAAVDDVAELLFAHLEAYLVVKGVLRVAPVDVAEVLRDGLVEYDAPHGGADEPVSGDAVHSLLNAHEYRCVQADCA